MDALEYRYEIEMTEFFINIGLRREDTHMPGLSWNGKQVDKICRNLDKLADIVRDKPLDISIPYIETCMDLYRMSTSKVVNSKSYKDLIQKFREQFDCLRKMHVVNMTPKIHKIYGKFTFL